MHCVTIFDLSMNKVFANIFKLNKSNNHNERRKWNRIDETLPFWWSAILSTVKLFEVRYKDKIYYKYLKIKHTRANSVNIK